jgi:hypothetical protein
MRVGGQRHALAALPPGKTRYPKRSGGPQCHLGNSSFERAEEFKYLGTNLTDQNSIQEEVKSRLKVRECLLLLGAESFVFQVAIQKLKA